MSRNVPMEGWITDQDEVIGLSMSRHWIEAELRFGKPAVYERAVCRVARSWLRKDIRHSSELPADEQEAIRRRIELDAGEMQVAALELAYLSKWIRYETHWQWKLHDNQPFFMLDMGDRDPARVDRLLSGGPLGPCRMWVNVADWGIGGFWTWRPGMVIALDEPFPVQYGCWFKPPGLYRLGQHRMDMDTNNDWARRIALAELGREFPMGNVGDEQCIMALLENGFAHVGSTDTAPAYVGVSSSTEKALAWVKACAGRPDQKTFILLLTRKSGGLSWTRIQNGHIWKPTGFEE